MSYVNLLEQPRSGHIDRRTLVRGLAVLVAPAFGVSLFANATLAGGGKKGKRAKKHKRTGKRNSRSGRGGASAQGCGGGCK